LGLAAAAWLVLAPAAWAEDEPVRVTHEAARDHVQTLANAALDILRRDDMALEEREATFRDLLREGFNLETIGNLALARNIRSASPTELEEYHQLFAEFVLARYSMLMGGYAGESFSILDARDSGRRDVVVLSQIERPGGDVIHAAWRVRDYNGAPKIIDVQVESISMVIAQRDEFNAVIQRGGFEALLESLRAQMELLPVEAPS
jgi:phospholipid transport system substrate-binding protein